MCAHVPLTTMWRVRWQGHGGSTTAKHRRSSGEHGLGSWWLSDDGESTQLGKDNTTNTMTQSKDTDDDHSGGGIKKSGGAVRLNGNKAMRGSSDDDQAHIMKNMAQRS